MKRLVFILTTVTVVSYSAYAQTASSLFLKSDKVQTEEIFSDSGNLYKNAGHHGPAVENSMMALRIYFNDSGAIDVYSKSGLQMELLKYLWYPTMEQQAFEHAGCDEYRVGKTVGLGGIALWDKILGREVKLVVTGGRLARVGSTRHGSYAEMISYGVPYEGRFVDISVRIDVIDGCRFAKVTATELNGTEVSFLTGVNYHPTCDTGMAKLGSMQNKSEARTDLSSFAHSGRCKSILWAWGVHPADVSSNPIPIGGGMFYDVRQFPDFKRTDDMLQIISRPRSQVCTYIISASTKETSINAVEKFSTYLTGAY